MSNFTGTICLSDIPKEMTRIGIDGKQYVDIFIGKKRKQLPFSSSHFISIALPPGKRDKYPTVYIGNAKENFVTSI